ncbi:hypothetical protein P7K49_034749 [Saguinus oedipus]|uniref:SEC7 domain-containing protein n=1 Tax=Saguinus oedipus TaxID=9490 RepID=A0ABQ9TVL7_SAGOE|nr:hypothetical protein P7K49_034749 [Saguinus oedipus]
MESENQGLSPLPKPPDLTPEERMELENIRRRKQELLVEIQRLREELSEAMSEVEGLEANEGSKTLQRNRKMAMGRKKFNMDPKKVLVATGLGSAGQTSRQELLAPPGSRSMAPGKGRKGGPSGAKAISREERCLRTCEKAENEAGPGLLRVGVGMDAEVPRGVRGVAFWPSALRPCPHHQGIQFLVENELLQNTPEEIARFLYKGEGLNKTAIGDYLGERYGHHSGPVGPLPPTHPHAQLLPLHWHLTGGTSERLWQIILQTDRMD